MPVVHFRWTKVVYSYQVSSTLWGIAAQPAMLFRCASFSFSCLSFSTNFQFLCSLYLGHQRLLTQYTPFLLISFFRVSYFKFSFFSTILQSWECIFNYQAWFFSLIYQNRFSVFTLDHEVPKYFFAVSFFQISWLMSISFSHCFQSKRLS